MVETVRTLALAMLAALAWLSVVRAEAGMPRAADANGLVVAVDWQSPHSLPRRFRNHCSYDSYGGRSYCSDHCGVEYQFYYCSHASFGCCGLGWATAIGRGCCAAIRDEASANAGDSPADRSNASEFVRRRLTTARQNAAATVFKLASFSLPRD